MPSFIFTVDEEETSLLPIVSIRLNFSKEDDEIEALPVCMYVQKIVDISMMDGHGRCY